MSKKRISKNTDLVRKMFDVAFDVVIIVTMAAATLFIGTCVLSMFDKITITIDK